MIVRYENRRAAKRAVQALQRLGLILKTEVYITSDATVYINCNTRNAAALKMLGDGEEATVLPGMTAVVELYRRQALIRFQAGTGANVPALRRAGVTP